MCYDQLGNRWQQNVTAGSGGASSLTFSGSNDRVDSYSYDASGNLLSDGVHTYTYDAENRIVKVDGGSTASYVYNAEGERVRKTVGATSVDYLYDAAGHEMTEVSATGGWNRGEIYAGGRHIATYNNGTTYFNHADWLGTERGVAVFDYGKSAPFPGASPAAKSRSLGAHGVGGSVLSHFQGFTPNFQSIFGPIQVRDK